MDEIDELKYKLQIIVLTRNDLKSIIERTAESTSLNLMKLLEQRINEQKDYYERLLPASKIALEF